MKRLLLASTMLLAFTVAPARAQTRVAFGASFGVPGPLVSGTVVVGEPPVYYYPRRPVVVYEEPRPWYYRPRWFVERRSHGWHRHYRRGRDWDEDR
jgi:hypothetical protein